jgi:hypothetical protein
LVSRCRFPELSLSSELMVGWSVNMEDGNCPSFSKRVLDALHRAGWTSQRDQPEMEDAYRKILGSYWVPAAAPFVRRFGGLSIDHVLWVQPSAELAAPTFVRRFTDLVQVKACTVAASNYMGDGCSIWCDEAGQFYAMDSEGIEFVGKDLPTVFEVLLFGAPQPAAPAEIADALRKANDFFLGLDSELPRS